MTLLDAGPLIAILHGDDPDHVRCVSALSEVRLPLVTTLAVLTEAMHFLGARFGWRGQSRLWDLITQRRVEVAAIDARDLLRCRELMAKYKDQPMDFADASLV